MAKQNVLYRLTERTEAVALVKQAVAGDLLSILQTYSPSTGEVPSSSMNFPFSYDVLGRVLFSGVCERIQFRNDDNNVF